METIKLKLSSDLKDAIKNKDAVATKTIRCLISEIDNAGAVLVEEPKEMPMSGGIAGAYDGVGSTEVARRELREEDIRQIIDREIDEINKTIELIGDQSRPEVKDLLLQIEILSKYYDFIK